MGDYIPAGNAEFEVWLNNFSQQLNVHGAAAGARRHCEPAKQSGFTRASKRPHEISRFARDDNNEALRSR